ncbi:MAG TPA: 4Fe-4S dicluster domain-containing protein [Geobacteraceae bacterium]
MAGKETLPKVCPARCTGCGRCVAACPGRLFTLETTGYRKQAVLNAPDLCSSCLRCVAECPVGAVSFDPGECPLS